MESLEVLNGRFNLVWDPSTVRIHDTSGLEPSTYRSRKRMLNLRTIEQQPTVLMYSFESRRRKCG